MSAHARPSLVALTVALIGAAVLLAACATPSAAPTAHALADSASLGAASGSHPWPDTRWWSRYGDNELDRLIDRALEGQPALQAVQARLRVAEAAVRGTDAARQPQAQRVGRPDQPALQRKRSRATRTRRRHALEQQRADRRRLGARPVRPQPRRARCRASATRARRRPMPRPRACCWRPTSPRATSSWRARSKRAASPATPCSSASRSWRWCASASAPGSTRRSSCARPKAWSRNRASRSRRSTRDRAAAATRWPRWWAWARRRSTRWRPRWPAWRRSRCPSSCRPTCWAAAPTSWRALARRGRGARRREARRAQFYPNINLAAFVGLSSDRPRPLRRSRLAGLRRRPGAAPADLRGRPAARQPALPDAPMSTRRSRAYNAALHDAVRDVADQLTGLRSLERQQREQAEATQRRRCRLRRWRCSATAPASATT